MLRQVFVQQIDSILKVSRNKGLTVPVSHSSRGTLPSDWSICVKLTFGIRIRYLLQFG
jgi:hypothetical protein